MSDTAPQIPPELYEHLTNVENVDQVTSAMQTFLDNGDEVTFEYAVALYLASARFRGEPIPKVLGVLTSLSESVQGRVLSPPSRLQATIFRGILRAFYGEVAVEGEGENGARAQGEAGATPPIEPGTWPTSPA